MSNKRSQESIDPISQIASPIPVRNQTNMNDGQEIGESGNQLDFRSLTPNTSKRVTNRRPSYNSIEISRESSYNLDYPEDPEEVLSLQLDPKSRFYARDRPRTMNLPKLLPYETELPKDQAKFLSHIVSHLYIAIKTLDIQGSLSVTAKDLASLRNVSGLSDLDIALETNLFEINGDNEYTADDDAGSYFSVDEYADSDSDYDEEDDNEDLGGEEDKAENESVVQHKKSPKSAAVVGVRIWTNELLVWLKMKYDMPLTLRIALAKVYYAICLCRGQYINMKIYVKTFELLTKDIPLLKRLGLTLDCKSLIKELDNHFADVDASVDNMERKEHKQLLKLAERASSFFEPESLPDIFDSLGKHLSISNPVTAICSMSAMPLVFSDDGISSIYDSRHYIAAFFYIWAKFKRSDDIDSHLTSRLGTVSMAFLTEMAHNFTTSKGKLVDTFGKYGIFTHEQIQILLSNLLNSFSILKEKFGSSSTNFFHGYVSTLVYSINGSQSLGKDGILENIDNLLNAIESFVYPTNTGPWTKPISKFVYSFIYQFHKRFNQENEKDGLLIDIPSEIKLNKQVVDKVVSIFLPIVRTGLQSKKSSAVDNYLSSLSLLAYLDSSLVLEAVLLDIYESLEGVISTHRVIVAIRTLDELARYFSTTKIFRVHLTRLLSLAVPGIDSNDLEKTLLTLSLFQTVANFVPFHDLNDEITDESLVLNFTQAHIGYLQNKIYSSFHNESMFGEEVADTFEVDDELEIQALKSSSALFSSLTKSLIQRIFTLLENIPDPNKSGRYEKAIADSLPKYLYIIFESMSDKIFKQVADMIFEFVFENTIHTVAEVIAEVCGAVSKRDPKFFKMNAPLLIEKIKEEIQENGSAASRTGIDIIPRDQPLFWYLIILNECVGNAGSLVIDIWDELNELVYFLMDNVKGPTVFAASYIVNQSLQALVKIKIKELRFILPKYIKEHGVDESCWGGFQFDEGRFSKSNFDFEWHLPSEKEVDCALNFFTDLTSKVLANILSLMLTYNKSFKKEAASLDFSDELRNNFLYLGYALSGVSFLFDPSFEEDIPKLSQHQNETIQQRLLLLNQIRSVKEEASKNTDELRIEDLQENLQKIVDDMSSEELIKYDHDLGKDSGGMDISAVNDKGNSKDDNFSMSPTPSLISKGLDYSKSNAFGFDRGDTESPDLKDSSHRASPGIEDVAISQMNPGITFRERKLYTSRYFFGDDMETRRSSENYIKLHRYRYLIGRSLHIICKFLTNNFHDNTKLFKNYLYLLNIWLSDVGRERLLDHSHIKVNYRFISATQAINRVHKPFTRLAFGSRVEAYHLLRVALHATSRTQTDLDKLLLEDLVKVSVSTYSAVAKAAQSTLVEAMKRLNGSYNVIIKTSLRYLSKALEEENKQKIESGLNLFSLNRIKNKVQNDYFNLQKYVNLLHRCLMIDGIEINDVAYALFQGVYENITPPSSICIIDLKIIDSIRPPDAFIDLEIKAVKLAKEKKREIYLDKLRRLESSIVANQQSSTYWKLSSMNISLLIGLQTDCEITTNDKVLRLLAKEASSDHPMISRLALKGITKILSKIYTHQLMDYKLENIYSLDYITRDTKMVDTHVKGSFYHQWRQEMDNTTNPNYFIDNKVDNGWLFWSDKLKVVVPDSGQKMLLNEKDDIAVRSFANCINKLWFHNIVNLWVSDNEAGTAYQATDVYVTFTIVLLVSYGYVNDLSFDDILDIVQDIYEKDDKSSHIVVCEILAGILVCSKHLSPELVEKRDFFVLKFLKNILNNDITLDTSGIWNVFAWWVPARIDIRRFPEISNMIVNIKLNKESDSPIKDSIKLSMVRTFVAATTWKLPHPERVVDMCIENINHLYQAVRDQIGSLLTMSSFVYYPDSIEDSKTFTEMCIKGTTKASYLNNIREVIPKVFKQIEEWKLEVEGKSPQEILTSDYIYGATTVLTWLKQALSTNVSVMYEDFIVPYIVPFLLGLTNMKEVCQLGNIDPITVLKLASQVTFKHENASQVVLMLKQYASEKSLTVVQSIIIGEFTETFYFKNLMKLDATQRNIVINFTNNLLYHKQVSVRESAASTLSGLIHISPPAEIDELIKTYSQEYKKNLDKIRKRHKKTGFSNITVEESIILHGSTLGLGSLIHAFPFLSPPPVWVPDLLTILANKSTGIPGIVGKTAKESLGKFKKTRQDTWHIDSKIFNESQMQDLEGVLLKSYFI